VTDVSVGFRPPCWCPYGWAPAWRLYTNLYKLVVDETRNMEPPGTKINWYQLEIWKDILGGRER